MDEGDGSIGSTGYMYRVLMMDRHEGNDTALLSRQSIFNSLRAPRYALLDNVDICLCDLAILTRYGCYKSEIFTGFWLP